MAGPVYTAGRYPLTDGLAGGGALQALFLPGQQAPVALGTRLPGRAGGVAQPAIKLESLTDDFTSQDNVKWTYYGTAAASGGQLLLTPTSAYDNKIDSAVTYDLTGSFLSAQVLSAPAGTGTIDTYLKVYVGADEVSFYREGANLNFEETVSGSTSAATLTYDAVAHAWWRIRHDGTNLLWETSPDGTAWTTQRTKAPARSWDNVTAQLLCGYYGTEPTPGTSTYDNLNLGAQPVSANADVALATGAAADATAAVQPNADLVTGSGSGFDAAPSVQVSAALASASGSALDAAADFQLPAQLASGTGTGFDATVSVGAPAALATAAGTALDASVSAGPSAGLASGTGVASQARVAHTYYVDPSGSDAADGYSSGTAWATIGKVNAAGLGAGDVVLFKRGGTWTGTELTVAGSGQSGSPILIGAYGTGALPVFDGGGTDTTVGTVIPIRLTGNWITVDSVQVQHSLETGLLIQGNDIECKNFVATHNPVGVGSSSATARHQLHDFQCIDNAVEIVGAGSNDDYGAIGISLSGDSEEVWNFVVSGSLTLSSPDYGSDGSMVEIFGATNALIRDGVGIDCETFTEMGDPSTTNVVFRNISYRSSFATAFGINVQGAAPFGPVLGVTVENCTILLSGANSQGFIVNSGAQCLFKNNIVQAAYLGYTPDPQDEEHNLWYGGANGNDVKSTHHATLSGLAPTDVIADPLWVNPGTGDLHLGNNSPAINLGIAVAWTTDLDGNPRTIGATPDAGAYEWQGPLAPAATGTGSASDGSGSVGAQAGFATGTGTAFDAAASVTATTGLATGTGSALDATVSVVTATNANADFATATGVAFDAVAAAGVNAGQAAGTGAGFDGATAVTVNADFAAGAGAGNDAVSSSAVNADIAPGTGTAFDTAAALTVAAGLAAASGTAGDALAATTAAADIALSAGTGFDTSTAVVVNADFATAAGAGLDAIGGVGPAAVDADATGTGYDTSTAVTVNADFAAGTGAGLDATVTTSSSTSAPAGAATGTGTAADGTVAVTVAADIAAATGAASDAVAQTGPRPTAEFFAPSGGNNTNTLTTPSFAVNDGDVIVVKMATWSTGVSMGSVTGGSQTWATPVAYAPGGFNGWVGITTTTVTGSPGTMTVSASPAATCRHSMVVEVWTNAALAGTPVTGTASSSGSASDNVSTSANNSVVTWVLVDENSQDPASRAYLGAAVEDGLDDGHAGSNSVVYYAYQQAPTQGSATFGLSAPTGLAYSMAGVEIVALGAAVNAAAVDADGSGAGFDATVSVAGNADFAAGTGVGYDATTLLASMPDAGIASGSGTAGDAGASIGGQAGAAAATGAGFDASTTVAVFADFAAGSGAGLDGSSASTAAAGSATGVGTAFDATVSTSSSTSAPADVALATGIGLDASVAVTTAADIASAVGLAFDGTGGAGGSAAVAAGPAAAFDATVSVGCDADLVSAVGDTPDGSTAVTVFADVALGAAVGGDGAALLGPTPGTASGVGVAWDATVFVSSDVTVLADLAAAAGVAFAATVLAHAHIVPAIILRAGATRSVLRAGAIP